MIPPSGELATNQLPDFGDLYDTVVEVIDVESGTVVIRGVIEDAAIDMPTPGLIAV